MSNPTSGSPAVVAGRARRFRVDVATIVTAVALTQSLLLVSFGYWGSQRLVTKVGESAHRARHAHTQDRVLAFLARSEAVVQALGKAPTLAPDGPQQAQTSELLWTLLQQSPELDSLYVADDQGQMLMAVRYPAPAIRQIVQSSGFTTETWLHKRPLDASGGDAQQRYATTRTETLLSHYDPRQREWYRLANQGNAPVWTPPYQFAAAHELGITFARPSTRVDAQGKPHTLTVAGDVSLGRLSEFVRQFASESRGDSALLSAQREVLARSDKPGITHKLQSATGGVLGALHERKLDDVGATNDAGGTHDTAFAFDYEGRRYLVHGSRIGGTGWQLLSWVPEDEMLGGLRRGVFWGLAVALALLLLALFVALRLSKLVTAPVENLSRIARRIGRLELDALPREHSRVIEIQHLDQALHDSARSLQAFRKFVPVDVINQLTDAGQTLAPGGSPRRVTVMFTDVEGFSAISESRDANALVAQLTEYFDVATRVFERHGGVIDKFIGDGIMALWGAPADLEDAEYQACLAALALNREMEVLNSRWRSEGQPEFRTRIGLHTGVVIVGVLGSHDRLAYTAFGDVVNAASRIEGINKQLGTRMLMSEETHAGLHGRLATRRIEEQVELRGRRTRMVLYQLMV